MNILGMNKAGLLLTLDPKFVRRSLTAEEVLYIAKTLDAFWQYDYFAAQQRRFGLHALLKSGLHSDGFFVSKILLEHENIRSIMARQIIMRLEDANIAWPDYIAGIPDGATLLGERVAWILGVPEAKMKKIDGRITLATEVPDGATLLFIEDFCTRGTGFTEAVLEVKKKNPCVEFVLCDPVIINRGGLKTVSIDGIGDFEILPVVEHRIQDWDPNVNCPLCDMGSQAIKPKASDENWRLVTTSQLQ